MQKFSGKIKAIMPVTERGEWKSVQFVVEEQGVQYPQSAVFAHPVLLLQIVLTFGFSNVASDADNPVKPLADILGLAMLHLTQTIQLSRWQIFCRSGMDLMTNRFTGSF